MDNLSPRQTRLAARFLDRLTQTANVALAAAHVGVAPSTLRGWRGRSLDLDHEWEAALVAARAALTHGGGSSPPAGTPRAARPGFTGGGEMTVEGAGTGRLQMRRARPGLFTAAGERTFLAAVAATANIRLSAESAGVSIGTVYHRRKRSAAFARALEEALQEGTERLEMSILRETIAGFAEVGREGEWREQADDYAPPRRPPDVFAAISVLGLARRRRETGSATGRFLPAVASEREVEEALHRGLKAVARREQRRQARAARRRGADGQGLE